MKMSKSIIALFMSVALIISLIVPVSGAEASNKIVADCYKIDSELEKIISDSTDNEIIPVVMWLSDVDEEERSDLITTKIETAEIKGELKSSVIASTGVASVQKDTLSNEDLSEQTQVLINIKREVEEYLHTENNSAVLTDLLSSYQIDTKPIFVSSYAPLVIMGMTKK